jgi:tripartite-type tricarboxylate transporter receptor subunit TctC
VTGPRRAAVASDIPTIAEAGVPGYEVLQWYGVLAPVKTPRETIARLHSAVVHAVQDSTIRSRIAAEAGEPVGNTPEAFTAILRADYESGATSSAGGNQVDRR